MEQDNNISNQEEVKETESKGKRIRGVMTEILIYGLIFIFCVIVIPRYVLCKYVVDGESMESTLLNKQQLIGEKVSYRFGDPDRFDIVVVQPFEDEEDNYYVKRIIGLPGETLEIKDDTIYIDGEELEGDTYKKTTMNAQQYGPITLGDDEYFVMGDNRNESQDSRSEAIGAIPKDRIIAHIVMRMYPFDTIRTFS